MNKDTAHVSYLLETRFIIATPLLLNGSFVVEAGHRAIMFNRIGGVGSDVYKEGLHFRIPWFQYPIIYDIRARPNQVRSASLARVLIRIDIICEYPGTARLYVICLGSC